MTITPFRDLIDQYDVILFDSYGVLKNYKGIIDGASEVFASLSSRGTRYRVLTNDASRSPEVLSERFRGQGINIPSHRIITSGMMARNFLETKTIDGKVLYLGQDRSSEYILAANREAISVADYTDDMIDEIGCLVFLDDEGYDWSTDINKVVNLLRKRTLPVVVANSDLIYPISKNDVHIATGAIASLVEMILGRRFIHYGKPDVQMFLYAYDDLLGHDPDLQKKNILMVGDTLGTDILGGIKFGINTALVLTGNTSREAVNREIEYTGIRPDYICESIVQ